MLIAPHNYPYSFVCKDIVNIAVLFQVHQPSKYPSKTEFVLHLGDSYQNTSPFRQYKENASLDITPHLLKQKIIIYV